MTVRDIRMWVCDVGGCASRAERTITVRRPSLDPGEHEHDRPTGWISITVNAIRGHHNVSKWLCREHANAYILPLFPEYTDVRAPRPNKEP